MSDVQPVMDAKPLTAHLIELRKRLLWTILIMSAGMGICFLYAQPIYGFLVQPLADAMGETEQKRLIYTGLTEAFFTYMKVAFFAGVFLTFPFLLWQVWMFIAPGLYATERKAVLPFMVATPILFFLGGACVYYLVLPLAWPFFLSFQTTDAQTGIAIQLEARVSEYLDLIMTFIFAFGLCFQLPVLLMLLARAGMITSKTLSSWRKYAIVIIFAVAAILTPPDVMSQTMLALPMIALYEGSIFLIRLGERRDAARPA